MKSVLTFLGIFFICAGLAKGIIALIVEALAPWVNC